MKQVVAWECSYCRSLHSWDNTVHERACRTKSEKEESDRAAYFARIENAIAKSIALIRDCPERADEILALAKIGRTRYGDSPLRDYVGSLIDSASGYWDCGSSHWSENMITRVIQSVIPDYKDE